MLRGLVLARRHFEHAGFWIGCRSMTYPPSFRPLQRLTSSTALLSERVYGSEIPATSTTHRNHSLGDGNALDITPEDSLIRGHLGTPQSLMFNDFDRPSRLKSIRSSSFLSFLFSDRDKVRTMAVNMAGSSTPYWAIQILNLAHDFSCPLKQNAYECVCHQLSAAKHWTIILRVVALGRRHTGRTTTRLLNWRVRALVEVHDYTALCNAIEEFRTHSLKPSRRTFHLILSAHIRNRDLLRAKECLQAMAEAGYPADASTDAVIAQYYRSLGADLQVRRKALESLHEIPGPTATTVINSLIRICLDTQDLRGVQQLLAVFDPQAIVAINETMLVGKDVNSYTALSGPPPTVCPNAATFSMFIDYQATKCNPAAAIKLFEAMIAEDIVPTSRTVVSLIHALFSGGQGDFAVTLFARICINDKQIITLFKPFTTSSPKLPLSRLPEVQLTVEIFNALLKGFLKSHGLNSIHAVLRAMRANHVKPDAKTLEIVLAHFNRGEHSRPRTLFRLLRSLTSPILRPTLRHMHLLLSCLLRHEKYFLYGSGWNTIGTNYSQNTKKRPSLNNGQLVSTADPFDPLAGLVLPKHLGYRGLAAPVLQSLSARQIKADSPAIALRMRHDAVTNADMDSAKKVFAAMLARGMHPNEYHFAALMEGYARNGDLAAAHDTMNSAERVGVKPNVVMYTILIAGYARHGNPELSIRTFQSMVAAQIPPDIPSIDAVSSAFFAVGAYNMAKRVLVTLWPHVQPFPAELRGASLKELACHFRALPRPNGRSVFAKQTKQQRLMLHWQIRDLVVRWKASTRRRSSPLHQSK
ncbi:hypothetical protein BDQ12DRAFT_678794 [Crucibulum laeve]|uniref:Pentacotripeptide-repeat region of PRORP domain-containing protein n=1 Tax=Crucibulum laeve TaxID=68775 RepID=A0A5C3M6U7_9AGAR|nr:hypothetical protein BDQ12DRAFT_678794 [Crucibulum laeve]